jgi:hypothetical protein
MKIFRIFKEFLDTKTYRNFTILNKNSNNLTRKYHTFLIKILHMITSQKYQEKDQEHIGIFLGFLSKLLNT